jgi:hypothetical protein
MKTKSTDTLLIILFILTIIGFMVTIYYLTIAEKKNFPVLIGSSILNILIVAYFIHYLIKSKKAE